MKPFVLLIAVLALGACNTIKGAGQDIAAGGATIAETAEKADEALQQTTY